MLAERAACDISLPSQYGSFVNSRPILPDALSTARARAYCRLCNQTHLVRRDGFINGIDIIKTQGLEMIRVIIADDHSLVRVALTRLFKEIKSIDIVAEASTGEQAVDLTRKHRPHVVLMDLLMPGIGGLEAARRIVQMEADIRVVAVTAADREPYPSQALKAGVTGYVTKGSSADELVTAVKRAYAAATALCGESGNELLKIGKWHPSDHRWCEGYYAGVHPEFSHSALSHCGTRIPCHQKRHRDCRGLSP